MKGFLVNRTLQLGTALLLLGLSAIGCATPTAVPPALDPTAPAPTVLLVTATPQTVPSTPLPQSNPPTSEPQTNLGATKTYRDEYAGFEFDYPATWNTTPPNEERKKTSVIYSATFFSWAPTNGGSEGIPADGTKIDVGVYNDGAPSPQAALELRKKEFATGDLQQTILSEQSLTLPSGLQVTRLHVKGLFGESIEFVTALNNRSILFGGVGDEALLDAIVRTLRPLSTSSN